jgi:hypothetical protein
VSVAHASSKPPAPSDRQPAVVSSAQATADVCAHVPLVSAQAAAVHWAPAGSALRSAPSQR